MPYGTTPSSMRITPERHEVVSQMLSGAATRADMADAFSHLARHFGYRYFSLGRMPRDSDEKVLPLLVMRNLPLSLLKEVDAGGLITVAPLTTVLRSAQLPLCLDLREHQTLCPQQLIDLLLQYGTYSVAFVPLWSGDGTHYMMTFSGNRPLMSLSELNEIGMLTLQAFRLYERLSPSETSIVQPLTRRELEVLRWASLGKTSVEIGDLLSLSDYTINTHLNSVIRKLDCVNRAQAVAVGLRLGLIE
ncbi:DNA-binding transcriptional regulator, CsgD family [Rhizobium sp. RU35A]|uniref:helix-turn-helix transcriptional regulator n=1 Tax=Rhizobium sp. RU35A TaxID=1907414 RepID=UPI000955527E|nr:LuxR family transcriptional regulator [Rhizobium sp. RU35A]SIQ36502.1 DNA-binding transcriptional regulator, CsgD family [Rhizobium sp. RU35A]